MTFIEAPPDRDAGDLTNSERAFLHRPNVMAAWVQLNGATKENMDLRRYELATVAAARRLRSSYCALAHGSVLMKEYVGPEELVSIAADHHAAGLDEVDVAVMDFAETVAGDATSVTQADVDRLRGLGLSDTEIFDVATAAAVRCFFSKTLDALGVQPDAHYAAMDAELRDLLVVGRPIADE